MAIQHLRSAIPDSRPIANNLAEGQLALNYESTSPGVYFKDDNGVLVKVGPVHVGSSAPNSSPAGSIGNAIGEQWLDTSGGTYVFKVWDGSAWRSEAGEFVNISGDTMTGALGVIAGSAAAPGVFVSGDTDTGIYSPGANQLAISTNGTGRLFVDASGNVGVRTATPADQFHVLESSASAAAPTGASVAQFERAGNAAITVSTADTGESSVFFGDTSSSIAGRVVYSHSANALFFGTNTITERARIDSSGRLLVGTSASATSKALQVEGTDGNTGTVSIRRNTNAQIAAAGLEFHRSRGGTLASFTTLNINDKVGNIAFYGADGTSVVQAGAIECAVDGTPSANDMPGRLVFSTTPGGSDTPVERVRVDSAGRSTFNGTGSIVISAETSSAAGTTNLLYKGRHSSTGLGTGTDCFIVYSNGNVVNTNNSYGAISDIKLKENIVDANSQWDDLKALQVRNYNFKEGQTHTQIGLIAQEAELVSPGLVSESPDRDEEGNDLGTVTKSINYSVLYMKAVKALQEAMERIEVLEAKVNALEGN